LGHQSSKWRHILEEQFTSAMLHPHWKMTVGALQGVTLVIVSEIILHFQTFISFIFLFFGSKAKRFGIFFFIDMKIAS
jgi:hypothetical protein